MNEYLEGRTLTEAGRHAGPIHADEPKLLDPKYDNLFKAIVMDGWCVKSTGDVESTTGYFSLTEIPSNENERLQMWDAITDEYTEEENFTSLAPDSGWYVTTEENQGFIFVYEMRDKKHAERVYDELEKAYLDWCDDDDGGPCDNPDPS